MVAMSSAVAVVAAMAAISGSRMRRTPARVLKNSLWGVDCINQDSTSGSSRCHFTRGRTTAPTRGLEYTRPLALSTRVASRNTERLTLYSSQSVASMGSLSSGLKRPETMCMPKSWTIWACMLLRGLDGW